MHKLGKEREIDILKEGGRAGEKQSEGWTEKTGEGRGWKRLREMVVDRERDEGRERK